MVERTNNARPTTLNPTRRFTVRLALATGATVATLLGAQTLALLERPTDAANAQEDVTATSAAALKPSASASAPTAVNPALPPSAPRLIVIRNQGTLPTATPAAVKAVRPSSQSGKQAAPASGNGGIAPPEAVVDQPPVVVQAGSSGGGGGGGGGQPAPATHSSR